MRDDHQKFQNPQINKVMNSVLELGNISKLWEVKNVALIQQL